MSDLEFYDKIFPRKLFKAGGTPVRDCRMVLLGNNRDMKRQYDEMKKKRPERFDFAVLNNVFMSFMKVYEQHIPPLTSIVIGAPKQKWNDNFFIHEGVKYRATYDTGTRIQPDKDGKMIRSARLTLHLPNNGFLYTDDTEMKVDDHNGERYVDHHSRRTYVTLDMPVLEKIPELVKFGGQYLQIKYWTFYYNFLDDRVDFEVEDSDLNCVQINFEPGYPEKDFRRDFRDFKRKTRIA